MYISTVEQTMSIPVTWVLASCGALAATISYLARIIYSSQQRQINILRGEVDDMRKVSDERSKTIDNQNVTIYGLQEDIRGLKQGCGMRGCRWLKSQE